MEYLSQNLFTYLESILNDDERLWDVFILLDKVKEAVPYGTASFTKPAAI